jgi:hypothetical protein
VVRRRSGDWRRSPRPRPRGRSARRRAARPARSPDRAGPPCGQCRGLRASGPLETAPTRGSGQIALDAADVDDTCGALIGAGTADRTSPGPSPDPGVRTACAADPEGNPIELLDRTTARAPAG